jgi:hypothetical protein
MDDTSKETAAYMNGREDGARMERERIVAWLRSISERTIHDWGLNAVGEISDFIENDSFDESVT